jgi:hypothetical protein
MTIEVRRRCECGSGLREFACSTCKKVVYAACASGECHHHNKPVEKFVINEETFLDFSWWQRRVATPALAY